MKRVLQLAFVFFVSVLLVSRSDAQWQELYSTYDTDVNGTGNRVPNVAVIHEDMFIAHVSRYESGVNVLDFMIPYINADSSTGMKYTYGYGTDVVSGIYQVWTDGAFDQVTMSFSRNIVATRDSFIYVANNDPEHNVLVFKYVNDTITTVSVNDVFPRQITGGNGIYGIDVDRNGYVYVCADTTSGRIDDIKIYKPMKQWTVGHTDAPVKTIALPAGIYKGITVSPNGDQIFVSDFGNRSVIKFKGSVTSGYTRDNTFSFTLGPSDTISGTPPKRARPLGLAYLSPNNIVAVACDTLEGMAGLPKYNYGRIYLLNSKSGALISADPAVSIVDQAKWNISVLGPTMSRGNGDASGHASCCTSTYDVKFDENGHLYSQSNYGWTVEKWQFNGTLPSFTSVEQTSTAVPQLYALLQNYPNPFNPATTIEFSLPASGFVSLKVFNVLGQEVSTLVEEEKEAGSYRIRFDARGLPSGTYFYRLQSGTYSEMKKMMFIK